MEPAIKAEVDKLSSDGLKVTGYKFMADKHMIKFNVNAYEIYLSLDKKKLEIYLGDAFKTEHWNDVEGIVVLLKTWIQKTNNFTKATFLGTHIETWAALDRLADIVAFHSRVRINNSG